MQEPQILDDHYTDEVKSILAKSKLPIDDIDLAEQKFVGILSDGQLTGIGALETHGSSALLRSMAVIYSGQKKGVGSKLVDRLLDVGKENDIKQVYLLTETAEEFFKKKGFKRINRSDVPQEILATQEFKHLCPSTALCMSLKL